jgi:hypothetical protein
MVVEYTGKALEELIAELPPPLRLEVRDFVEFLLSKQERKQTRRLRQDWANSIQVHGQSSVGLQHQALIWREQTT